MSEAMKSMRYDKNFLSLPQRTHVCLIYSREHERRTSISQYVNGALSKNDKFLYVTDATIESTLEWLNCPDASEQNNSGQFMIDVAKQLYCPCGHFVPKEMLAKIEKFNQVSLKQGYRGFSGTGEMSWATRGWPGSENLIDYEAQLNDLVFEHSLTLLCQYDVNRFDGGIILDVLRVHPKVFINGQVVENPFYQIASEKRPSKKASLEPDSQVLAELMLVQGLLYVFPTETKISEFVCRALERIPGCSSCVVDYACRVYHYEDGQQTIAQETTILPIDTDAFSLSENLDECVKIPLTTYKRLYGYLILEVHDQSLFKLYEPHIHTVANSIAITFENRWQQRELNTQIERYKDTAEALQHAVSRTESIVRDIRDGVITFNKWGNLTSFNPGAEQIFGYDASEAVGQSVALLFLDVATDEHEPIEALINQFQAANLVDGTPFELQGRQRNNSEVLLEWKVTQGKVDNQVVYTALIRDITEAKRAAVELQNAKDAAEAATQTKSNFLANMSHELRTPLNSIIGFTRLVAKRSKDILPPKQHENLNKVLISAKQLLALINDILDLSKVESGLMDVQRAEIALPSLIDECTRSIEPMINSKSIRLIKYLDSDLPAFKTDAGKLRQILINLLSNAVKFTDEGAITVTVKQTPDRSIAFTVADTGIGIPEDTFEQIFGEFSQLDASRPRPYGGTGLGLAITRRLAGLLGGEVTVKSTMGAGSTFTVTLPIH